MVAIVTGNSLGLSLLTSGAQGASNQGRAAERVYVNSATGNLVIQGNDEYLASVGLDTALIRTYNSKGLSVDDNGDNWQLNVASLINRPATPNAVGSTVTKRFGDGAEALYTYDASRALYVSSLGEGAADTLSYNTTAQQWTWTDGTGRDTEIYNSSGRLINTKDVDGNTSVYTYNSSNLLIQIRDAAGQDTFIDYTGNNITKIRVVSQGITQTLTRYGYDGSNRLTSVTVDLTPGDNAVTDGKTYVTTYTYDGTSKRVATITQTDGSTLTFTYEPFTTPTGTTEYRVKTYKDAVNQPTILTYTNVSVPAIANANPGAVLGGWATESLRESTDIVVAGDQLDTVFDQNGNGMVVWEQNGGIYVSTYTKSSNTWSASTQISSGTFNNYPSISMSANGTAIVAWNNGSDAISATRFMGGSWSAVTQVINETSAMAISRISCSINDAGQAVVAVRQHSSSTVSNLWVTRLNGSTWSTPTAVDDIGGTTNQPALLGNYTPVNAAIDSSGNVTLAWMQYRPGESVNSIFVSRYTASSNTWSTPNATLLENTTTAIDQLIFVANSSGNGMAAWKQGGSIMARSFTASTNTWGTVVTLATAAPQTNVYGPDLDVSSNGNVVATWFISDIASGMNWQMGNCNLAGAWGTATLLSQGKVTTDLKHKSDCSINNNGEAAVTFVEINYADPVPRYDIFVNRFSHGSWQGASRVDSNPNSTAESSPIAAVVIDAQGYTNVLWAKSRVGAPASDSSLYSNRFTPPYYTVVAGDTWASIASKIYGDADAANSLQSKLNNPALTVGARLTVPLSLSYTATLTQCDVLDPAALTTSYRATSNGQLREVLSPTVGGVRLSTKYQYDDRGNVLRVTDSLNQVTVFEYDANDNLTLTRDALGNTVTYSYNSANQRLAETRYLIADVDGAGPVQPLSPVTTKYIYDSELHLRFTVSGAGRVTEHRYDTAGNLTATIRYVLNAFTGSATESALTTWIGTQNLVYTERTDYTYDFRGQVRTTTTYAKINASGAGIVDGTESRLQFVYDQRGKLLTTISGKGDTTQYTYDGMGRVLTVVDALLRTTITSYDDVGAKTKITLANGLATTSTYDKASRLISLIDTNPSAVVLGTTKYFYDSLNRLRMTQDPTGVRTFNFYDEASRLIAQIDGNGSVVEYRYNQASQVTRTIAYSSALTSTQLSSLVDVNGNPTNVAYSTIRPASVANVDINEWRLYDNAGRLVKTIDTVGAITDTFYDGDSRVTQTTAYFNRLTAVAVAALGDTPTVATVTTSANDRTVKNFYDFDGLLKGSVDGEGFATEYSYDYAGRLSQSVRYNNPFTGTTAFVAPATHADDQRTFYFYSASGQLTGSLDAEFYLTEYQYDKAGNRNKTIQYAAKSTAAVSNTSTVENVRPTTPPVPNPEDRTATVVYDALNRVSQETNPEGVVTQYTYDTVGNLTRSERAFGTAEVRIVQARYDLQGNLVGELTGEGSSRLVAGMTQAQVDAIWRDYGLTHAYDTARRRVSTVDQIGNKTLFYYDVDGRLTHSVNALGEVSEAQYNALGEKTAEIAYGTRIAAATLSTLTGGLVNTALINAVNAIKNASLDSKVTYSNTRTTLPAGSFLWRKNTVTDALGIAFSENLSTFGDLIFRSTFSTDPLDVSATTGAKRELLTAIANPDRRGLVTSASRYGLLDNVVTDATTTLTTYDAFGRAKTSTDGNNNVTTFTYDHLGQVIQTRDGAGKNRYSTYDAVGRTLTTTDALNNITRYTYSKTERSVTIQTPEGISVKTIYNLHGEVARVIDGRGNITDYTYDKNGNLLSVTDGAGTARSEYDRADRLVISTDKNGGTVKLSYDAVNRIFTRTVDPTTIRTTNDNPTGLNLSTSYQYDAKGNQIQIMDTSGTVTRLEYDLNGQLFRQTIDPTGLNLVTSYTYEGRGLIATVTDSNNVVTRYHYDSLGRRDTETVAGVRQRSYQYDANDNVAAVTDALGNVSRFYYDQLNRQIYALDALSGLTQTVYDAEGQVVKTIGYANALVSLPLAPTKADIDTRLAAIASSARDQADQYVYDKDGRRIYSLNALGEVTQFTYDANSNVIKTQQYGVRIPATTAATATAINTALGTAVANAGANALADLTSHAVYDAANRQIYSLNAAGEVTQFTYDANSNVVKTVRYANRITFTLPLTAGNVANAITTNAATDQVGYAIYDRANRPVYQFNATGEATQFTYDVDGNVIKATRYANRIAPAYYLVPANPNGGALNWTNIAIELYGNAAAASAFQGVPVPAANSKVGFLTTLPATVTVGGTTYTLNTKKLTDYKTPAEVAAQVIADGTRDAFVQSVYDNANRAVYTFNALGEVTELTYDANGNVTKTQTYAKRIVIPTTVNAQNIKTALGTTPSVLSTDYAVYDGLNRVAYTFNAVGEITEFSYDTNNNVVKSTRYGVRITPSTLPSPITTGSVATAIITATTNAGANALPAEINYAVYDNANRLTYQFNALGEVSENVYDGQGRVIKTIQHVNRITIPTTRTVQTVRDALTASGANSNVDESISRVYDAAGREVFHVNGQGEVSEFVYDTHGNVVKSMHYKRRISTATTMQVVDINNALNTVGRSYANVEFAVYDNVNRLAYAISAFGVVTEYRYDAFGNAVKTQTYSEAIFIPAGINVGNVAALVRPNSTDRVNYAVYDAAGRLVYGVSALGEVTKNIYDATGNVVKITRYANTIAMTTAMTVAGVTAAIAADGTRDQTMQYTYDKTGRRTGAAQLDGAGVALGTTKYFYDNQGRVVMTQDPLGLRTFILYDTAGNRIADIDANGSLVEYSYDTNGKVTRAYAYSNALTASAFASLVDGSGNPTTPALSSIRPATDTTNDRPSWIVYDAAGRLIKTINAEGAITETVYDGEGRVTSTIERNKRLSATPGTPPWATTVTAPTSTMATVAADTTSDRTEYHYYDNEGREVASVDAERYLTEYVYDGAGRLAVTTRHARQLATNWQSLIPANPSGAQVLTAIRPATHADNISTKTIYDMDNRVVGQIDGENYLTETQYDNFGNATYTKRYVTRVTATVVPGESDVWQIRPTDNQEDRSTRSVFDLNNRLIQETGAEGAITKYFYDKLGRLVQTDRAAAVDARTNQVRYDLQGRVIGELAGEGSAKLAALVSPGQLDIDNIWRDWGIKHTYDADGQLTSTTDQYGNKTLFYYNEDGALRFSINAMGEVAETRYNTLDNATDTIRYGKRLTSATLATLTGGLVNSAITTAVTAIATPALDSKTSVAYFITGNIASSTDALNAKTSYEYNAFGEKTRSTLLDPTSGRKFGSDTAYDRRGLAIQTNAYEGLPTAPKAKLIDVVYDAFGRVTSTTDTLRHTRSQKYDRLGNVVQTQDNAGNIRYSTYDAFNRALTHTNVLNETTSYVYNRLERSVTITTPEGVITKTTTNVHGETELVIDGNGQETRYTYNKDGRLVFALDPLWHATSTDYDRAGRVFVTRDKEGNAIKFEYDAANRVLFRTVDPVTIETSYDNPQGLNLVTSYQYDAKGNRILVTDANAVVTKLEYDVKGQLLRQTLDPTTITNPNDNPTGLNLVTSYTYDARDLVLTITQGDSNDPKKVVTSYHYDAIGRRDIENVAGVVTRQYQYDGNNQVVCAIDANGNKTRYVYNNLDQLVYTVDGTGAVTENAYDKEGRLTRATRYATRLNNFSTLPNATTLADVQSRLVYDMTVDLVEHGVYDKDGRVKATVNAAGNVVKLQYDGNGNVIDRYAYANAINMTSWVPGTDPTPIVDNLHDRHTRTIYDAANRATLTLTQVYGGLAITEAKYDRNGSVIESIHYSGILQRDISATELDIRQLLVGMADTVRDLRNRYMYDNAGRQTHSVNGVGAVTQSFYDGVGNVTKTVQYATAITPGSSPTSVIANNTRDRVTIYAYDKANREVYSVNSVGAVTQTYYDKNGNEVARVTYASALTPPTAFTEYTLTSLNSAVTNAMRTDVNNRIAFFTYDAMNRKVLSVDALGGTVKRDYDATGNVIQTTAYANQIDLTVITPANAADSLPGWVASINDPSHDRVTKHQYDAVGRELATMDALGYVTESVYDGNGNVTRTVQYGSTISTAVEPASIVATAHATLGSISFHRHTDFEYDAAGRLSIGTDAYGKTEIYGYDGVGNKTSYTNKNGAGWTYDYDSGGRLVAEVGPPVRVMTVNASGFDGALQSGGSVWHAIRTELAYDALGNVTSRTEAAGRPEQRTTSYQYDALGRQVKVLHPPVNIQNPADATFNSLTRNEITVTLSTETRYDTLGNAYLGYDTAGRQSHRVYDRLGQLRYEIDVKGYITGFTRNTFGEVTLLTRYAEPSGFDSVVSQLNIDTVTQRLGELSHADDRASNYQHDRLGRVVWEGELTTFVYDTKLNQYATAGKVTRTSYNAFGDIFQISQNKAPFDQWNYVSTRYYNLIGRQVAEVDALGHLTTDDEYFQGQTRITTHTEYEDSLIDWNPASPPYFDAPVILPGEGTPGKRVSECRYDALDRKTQETLIDVEYADETTFADNGRDGQFALRTGNVTTTYGYDAVGNQTRVTDGDGNTTYTYYDVLGRVRAIAAPERIGLVDAFDASQSLMTARALTELYYDARGNVVAKYDFTYGASAVSTNEQQYQYSSGPLGIRASYSAYDAMNHVVQHTDATGVSRYSSYNTQGKLARTWQKVTDVLGNVAVSFEAYRYDARGSLIETLTPPSISDLTPGVNQVTRTFTTVPFKRAGNQDYLPWDATKTPLLVGTPDRPVLQLYPQIDQHGKYQYVRFRPYGASDSEWTYVLRDAQQQSPYISVQLLPAPPAGAPYALEIDIAFGLVGDPPGKRYTGSIIRSTATGPVTMTPVVAGTNTITFAWNGLIDLNAGLVRVDFNFGGVARSQTYNPTEVAERLTYVWEDYVNGTDASKLTGLTLRQEINGVWTTLYTGTAVTSPLVKPGLVSAHVSYNAFGDVIEKRLTAAGAGTGIDPVAGSEYYDYDSAGRLWRTNAGDGIDKIFLYDVAGNLTARISSDGEGGVNTNLGRGAISAASEVTNLTNVRRTDFQYDALGRLIKETRPVRASAIYPATTPTIQPIVNYTVDRWGNVLSVSDARDANWLTEYRYNAQNRVVWTSKPAETAGDFLNQRPVTHTFYDKLGRQIGTATFAGAYYDPSVGRNRYDYQVNRVRYDGGGNIAETIDALGNRTYATHNFFGEKVASVNELAHRTRYAYDSLGRLTRTTYPDVIEGSTLTTPGRTLPGVSESIIYDELGRKIRQTNGAGNFTRYRYDLRGNVIETLLPISGKTIKAGFDALGRKTAERDANGYASTWRYDYFGRLRTHTDLGTARYTYVYDRAGSLTRQTNTRGQDITFDYDVAGQLVYTKMRINVSIYPYTEATYGYDAAGNRTLERTTQGEGGSLVTRQNQVIAYDQQNRITTVSDSRVHLTIDYDLVGNRRHIYTRVIDGSGFDERHRHFRYDAMNRQTLIDAANVNAAAGSYAQLADTGHAVTYDAAGNRVSDTHFVKQRARVQSQSGSILGYDPLGRPIYTTIVYQGLGAGMTTERYTYDSMNRLQTVALQSDPLSQSILVDYRTYDGASRVLATGPQGNLLKQGYASLKTALGGDQGGVVDGLESRTNSYDANGRLLVQDVKDALGADKYKINYTGGYDAAGNLTRYTLQKLGEGGYTNTYLYTYDRFESYLTKTVESNGGEFTPGTTTHYYDINGHLAQLDDARMNENDRVFTRDIGGKPLEVAQNGKVQRQLIVNGEVLGRYGMVIDPEKPREDSGLPRFKFIADFNFGYQPIDANYPVATPGLYTVRIGDTLQSIAQGAYGDSSYWYLIADANGLSGSETLTAGTMLQIPNRVGTSHNNANTYKPYDAGLVIGDTTPFMPLRDSGGCGGWGLVIVIAIAIAVAVVVSIITYGAAAPLMASALGTTIAAATATQMVIIGAVAGAAAAMAGSFASQLILTGTGVKKEMSGKEILIAGAAGAVTGGIGGYISAGAQAANQARSAGMVARDVILNASAAMAANALTQGFNMKYRGQEKFDWASLGLTGAAAIVPGTQGAGGKAIAARSATDLAAGIAYHTIQDPSWKGGKMQMGLIVADAFGNAIGSAVGGKVAAQMQAEIDWEQNRSARMGAAKDVLAYTERAEGVMAQRRAQVDAAESGLAAQGSEDFHRRSGLALAANAPVPKLRMSRMWDYESEHKAARHTRPMANRNPSYPDETPSINNLARANYGNERGYLGDNMTQDPGHSESVWPTTIVGPRQSELPASEMIPIDVPPMSFNPLEGMRPQDSFWPKTKSFRQTQTEQLKRLGLDGLVDKSAELLGGMIKGTYDDTLELPRFMEDLGAVTRGLITGNVDQNVFKSQFANELMANDNPVDNLLSIGAFTLKTSLSWGPVVETAAKGSAYALIAAQDLGGSLRVAAGALKNGAGEFATRYKFSQLLRDEFGGGPVPFLQAKEWRSGVVAVSPNVEVTPSLLRPGQEYLRSYTEFVEQVRGAPVLKYGDVSGQFVGSGTFHNVEVFKPSPEWVLKLSKGSWGDDITAGSIREMTLEAASLKRMQMVGMNVPEVEGLIRIGNQPFGKLQYRPGLLMQKIEHAFDLRFIERLGARNLERGHDFWKGIPDNAVSPLNASTVADMDASIEAQLRHGFTLNDQQALVSRPTGRYYEFDPQRINPWGTGSDRAVLQQVILRNRVANVVGISERPITLPTGVKFNQWWEGNAAGFRPTGGGGRGGGGGSAHIRYDVDPVDPVVDMFGVRHDGPRNSHIAYISDGSGSGGAGSRPPIFGYKNLPPELRTTPLEGSRFEPLYLNSAAMTKVSSGRERVVYALKEDADLSVLAFKGGSIVRNDQALLMKGWDALGLPVPHYYGQVELGRGAAKTQAMLVETIHGPENLQHLLHDKVSQIRSVLKVEGQYKKNAVLSDLKFMMGNEIPENFLVQDFRLNSKLLNSLQDIQGKLSTSPFVPVHGRVDLRLDQRGGVFMDGPYSNVRTWRTVIPQSYGGVSAPTPMMTNYQSWRPASGHDGSMVRNIFHNDYIAPLSLYLKFFR